MSDSSESDDHDVASSIALLAGALLVALRRDSALIPQSELGDEGDRCSNDAILRELAARRPMDAVLSEETASVDSRLTASRVWVVDPLDGTREFREGRSDWAVHVALVVDGAPKVGAVALPALDLVLSTSPAPTLPARDGSRVRLVVSRTRPPEVADAVAKALDAEVVHMGSVGAKAGAVVRGEADIYLHAGGQYEWDSAAPVAVAVASGLHASRLDGTPLVYNRPSPWLPDLLICRPELASAVLAITNLDGEAWRPTV